METNTTPMDRMDGVSAQRFKEMTESAAFGRLHARIEAELRRAEESCVQTESEAAWRRGQGSVAALRMVLGLPAQILAELKSKSK